MQGISDKLRELTHYDHGASAVNQALHVIQDALQCTTSHRSRFEENSLVWLIPACTPHVEPATTGCDDEIAARAGAACAAEVRSLLQNTAVQRAARCQSSRQWSAAERLLTRQRVGSKSVRVRIGEHFIERIPAHLLPLFRLDFCHHHLQLPAIAMIFGDKTGGGQLVCFQSRREKKSGSSSIAPSVESGPLESAYVSSWETAAEAVALAAYSGVNRLIGDLRIVDLTAYNLRLLFSARIRHRVDVPDFRGLVEKNLIWLLVLLDDPCVSVIRKQHELQYVAHTAEIARLLWKMEGRMQMSMMDLAATLVTRTVVSLAGVLAAVIEVSCDGAVVAAALLGRSVLLAGDVIVDCDDADLTSLPAGVCNVVLRGSAGQNMRLVVLRDGARTIVDELLCAVDDVMPWLISARTQAKAAVAVLRAANAIMLRATDAVAAAYGTSATARTTSVNQTNFELDVGEDALHVLQSNSVEVSGALHRQLALIGVAMDLTLRGCPLRCYLYLPQQRYIDPVYMSTLGHWAEQSVLRTLSAEAIGFCMSLTQAISHMLLSAAVRGELSHFFYSSTCALHFRNGLKAQGPTDGGSAGRCNVTHFLAVLVELDVQCGAATGPHLLKGRVPLVWADWIKVYLHEKKAIARSEGKNCAAFRFKKPSMLCMRSPCLGGPKLYTLCVSL